MDNDIEDLKTCKNSETWFIIFSDKLERKHKCICGHYVKRITFVYHQNTKAIIMIGTTCLKKYNVHQHLNNRILLVTLKNCIYDQKYRINEENENTIHIDDFSIILKNSILDEFHKYQQTIQTDVLGNLEINYYDVVLPFRRLLDDVCYLVTEYHYDYMDLLKEIKNSVEHMNQSVKHIMIDEKDSDVSSEENEIYPIDSNDNTVVIFNYDQNDYIQDVNDIYSTFGLQDVFLCDNCDEVFYNLVEKDNHQSNCILQDISVEDIPVQDIPVQDISNILVEDIPVQDISVEDISVQDILVEDIPVQDISNILIEDISVQDISVEDIPVQDISNILIEDIPVQDISDILVEDIPVQDISVEDIPVQDNSDIPVQDNSDIPVQEKHFISIIERYSKATKEELTCSFCLANIKTYCFCEFRQRMHKLVIEIMLLRQQAEVTNRSADELLKKTRMLKAKYL